MPEVEPMSRPEMELGGEPMVTVECGKSPNKEFVQERS